MCRPQKQKNQITIRLYQCKKAYSAVDFCCWNIIIKKTEQLIHLTIYRRTVKNYKSLASATHADVCYNDEIIKQV